MHDNQDATERQSEYKDDFRLERHYERRRLRLGKRLAYLLRYGAEKEGCQVDEGILKNKIDGYFILFFFFPIY